MDQFLDHRVVYKYSILAPKTVPNHHTQKQNVQVSGCVIDTNRNQLKPKWQVVPIWVNQHPIGGEKCSDFAHKSIFLVPLVNNFFSWRLHGLR